VVSQQLRERVHEGVRLCEFERFLLLVPDEQELDRPAVVGLLEAVVGHQLGPLRGPAQADEVEGLLHLV
jgi:hypothetical protein